MSKNFYVKNFKRKKKKIEFAKFIVALYACMCIIWVSFDYLLAFLYQQPVNAQVTVVVIPSIAVSILGYYYKSLKEKQSRNEYGLDENGVPYNLSE